MSQGIGARLKYASFIQAYINLLKKAISIENEKVIPTVPDPEDEPAVKSLRVLHH